MGAIPELFSHSIVDGDTIADVLIPDAVQKVARPPKLRPDPAARALRSRNAPEVLAAEKKLAAHLRDFLHVQAAKVADQLAPKMTVPVQVRKAGPPDEPRDEKGQWTSGGSGAANPATMRAVRQVAREWIGTGRNDSAFEGWRTAAEQVVHGWTPPTDKLGETLDSEYAAPKRETVGHVLDAIAAAEPVRLYRGLVMSSPPTVGEKITDALSSWTGQQRLALSFARQEGSARVPVLLVGDVRGVPISRYAATRDKTLKGAQEYLSSGEYVVTKVVRHDDNVVPYVEVHVRHERADLRPVRKAGPPDEPRDEKGQWTASGVADHAESTKRHANANGLISGPKVLAYARENGGMLHRWTGGYWSALPYDKSRGDRGPGVPYVPTVSVQSHARKGALEPAEERRTKDGGRFVVAYRLTSPAEVKKAEGDQSGAGDTVETLHDMHDIWDLLTPEEQSSWEYLTPEEQRKLRAQAALRDLDFKGWTLLVNPTAETLKDVTGYGGREALAQLGIEDGTIFDRLNEDAIAWAEERAAELVGMRVLEDGSIVENPNPAWAITDTTRDLIRGDVTEAFTEGMSRAELADRLQQSFAFSEARANMIARTEISTALIEGNMDAWRRSGQVEQVQWLLSNDHPKPDECDSNAAEGPIELGQAFPSGDDSPPAHPHCECDVVPLLTPEDAG